MGYGGVMGGSPEKEGHSPKTHRGILPIFTVYNIVCGIKIDENVSILNSCT